MKSTLKNDNSNNVNISHAGELVFFNKFYRFWEGLRRSCPYYYVEIFQIKIMNIKSVLSTSLCGSL